MNRLHYIVISTLLAVALVGLSGCADDDTSAGSTPDTTSTPDGVDTTPDNEPNEPNEPDPHCDPMTHYVTCTDGTVYEHGNFGDGVDECYGKQKLFDCPLGCDEPDPDMPWEGPDCCAQYECYGCTMEDVCNTEAPPEEEECHCDPIPESLSCVDDTVFVEGNFGSGECGDCYGQQELIYCPLGCNFESGLFDDEFTGPDCTEWESCPMCNAE